MSWRRQLAKLGALFRRPKPVHDLAEEIRLHLEMEEQENLESGMPPDEAHYAALRRFGNVTLTQERSREMWVWDSVETLWQDLRYGARMLSKNPSFTAVAVLTLALGIGANTAIFSIMDAVLNLHFPIKEQNRIVNLWAFNNSTGATRSGLSTPDFLDYRQQNQVFEDLAAYSGGDFHLTNTAEPKSLSVNRNSLAPANHGRSQGQQRDVACFGLFKTH